MSWLFSDAMMKAYANSPSLQALVEEYSADTCSDGEPFVQLSGNPTPQAYLSPDKMTDFSRLSRFGMTFRPLMDDHGEAVLMSYLEAFPVRTSVQPEKAMDLMESDPACGFKWQESFAKYSRAMCLWKTRQCSLLGDWDEYLETWPQWGLMQDGECLALTSPVMTIAEIESGLLPTVLSTDWKGGTVKARTDNGNQRFDQWRHYIKLKYGMNCPHPMHSELRMAWPLEWTDLKPLETDRFRQWQQQHGDY